MSLDGLRAWIGEVERKLGMRTRVFLVLVAIAIGGAGAGIYLALEADDSGGNGGASSEQVEALEQRIDALGVGSDTSLLETRLTELEGDVEDLEDELDKGSKGSGGAEEKGGSEEKEAE